MRLLVYTLIWLGCNLVIVGCVMALGLLLLFYTTLGPIACMVAGARLGYLCGLDFFVNSLLTLAGLWLFGSIRIALYRRVLRVWRKGNTILARARTLRDDLWRQYRRALSIPRRP